IFIGKNRQYNRRFLQMCSHHLVEPVAGTRASGWEKGQVENQVGLVRERFFTPRLRVKSYDELNAWLMDTGSWTNALPGLRRMHIRNFRNGRSGRCSRKSGRSSFPIASATAFLLSELADFAVYTPLQRKRLVLAVVASSVVGLTVDSVVFLQM